MKIKHTVTTGTAIIALLFITMLFAGCGTLGELYGFGDTSTSGGDGGGGSTAASVQYVPDGTYTIYPRLRASQGGVDKKVYLDRIESKGGNVTFYLVDRPLGKGNGPGGNWRNWTSSVILQDLDRPARSYNVINAGELGYDGHQYLTFEKVTGTRFSLAQTGYDPQIIFDEIILGEPDKDLGLSPLKNGTYTYYPRQQASQGGVDKKVYLDRIVIRSGYLTVYLVDRPEGKGNGPEGNWRNWTGSVIIQDLDHPQLVYNVTNAGEDGYSGPQFLTFEKVTAKRFSLTQIGYDPPIVFDEIIIGEPDA